MVEKSLEKSTHIDNESIKILYVSVDEIININIKSLYENNKNPYIGKYNGIKDKLNSILIIENDYYYPNIIDKSVHIFYSMIKNHYFPDANKRTALYTLHLFLEKNNIINKENSRMFLDMFKNIAVLIAGNVCIYVNENKELIEDEIRNCDKSHKNMIKLYLAHFIKHHKTNKLYIHLSNKYLDYLITYYSL